ncbi:hypothetical protein [Halotalea alkalilenta]|uniref:Uncharacterized protein n=1 Tax=Halotalea alkalilenta TaxID=376489 RepID=A0A172YEE1_9GAMM|nr:hypothetical protein [Halotalea alkalilenta]ANF57603.1 hypothetical protein A5892_09115 [Halotalea alkalilenta]
MSEEQPQVDDAGRVVALQVGFAALIELVGRERPELRQRVLECLRQTGENPANAHLQSAFTELTEMVEGLAR